MKPIIWLCLAFLILLAACGPVRQGANQPYLPPPGSDGTQAYPPPQVDPGSTPNDAEGYPPPQITPSPISWEEARSVILAGKVVEAIQLHSLTVYLVLKDGTQLITEEPEVDAVLVVIDDCGSPCENIEIITE